MQMTPENLNGTIAHEFKRPFKPNESILVNNQYGITVTCKHKRIHISVLNNQNMRQQTNDLESGLFNKLSVGDIIITASQTRKDKTEVKIESDEKIDTVSYNYPQNFFKLFEFRINRRNELTRLSKLIAMAAIIKNDKENFTPAIDA